jgi:hypothetical protein
MFFAQITETLFEVTIPDSNIAKPAAMNMTRKPQIKNNRVLKINPTSADTVVSAIPALLMFNKNIKLNNGAVILFINLVIRPPVKEMTYKFINFKN